MSKSKAPSEKSARSVIGIRLSDDELARVDEAMRHESETKRMHVSRAEMLHSFVLRGMEIGEEERGARRKA